MNELIYKDPTQGKTLSICYPNMFDIEHVSVVLTDESGKSVSFMVSVKERFGEYLKNYFDPRPVDVMRKMAEREE